MKTLPLRALLPLFFSLAVAGLVRAALPDAALIERVTGLKGAANEAEGVFKVTKPRADLGETVEARAFAPFMGFTSWAAFNSGGKAEAMVMGDLVLLEDEVGPAMSALLDAGLEVTALHNHFFYASPQVYFMHLGGEGATEALAKGVRAAFDAVAAVRAKSSAPAKDFGVGPLPAENAISAAPLEQILGAKAQVNAGMAKWVFGREVMMACGCPATKDMGVNTWAAFAGTDASAAAMGDFAVLENELTPVLKSLRHDGVNVVAIHQHMLRETPRMLFLHYYGRGPAASLAMALKHALAEQAAVAKSATP